MRLDAGLILYPQGIEDLTILPTQSAVQMEDIYVISCS